MVVVNLHVLQDTTKTTLLWCARHVNLNVRHVSHHIHALVVKVDACIQVNVHLHVLQIASFLWLIMQPILVLANNVYILVVLALHLLFVWLVLMDFWLMEAARLLVLPTILEILLLNFANFAVIVSQTVLLVLWQAVPSVILTIISSMVVVYPVVLLCITYPQDSVCYVLHHA